MNEHPILFSAPMVHALHDGTKTQTRRTAKLDVRGNVTTIRVLRGEHKGSHAYLTDEHGIAWSPAGGDPLRPYPHPERCCPYGEPGDRLWVRETWAPWSEDVDERGEAAVIADAKAQMPWAGIVYRADANGGHVHVKRWRPSIFLPRWASRMSLEITGVRVERLQAITEDDAKAEGVTRIRVYEPEDDLGDEINGHGYAPPLASYAGSYEVLWDEINGKRASWSTNPWVWVVEFTVPRTTAAKPIE